MQTTLSDSSLLRRFRVPAYVILILGGAFPFVDWLMTIYPLHLGSVPWRFGAAGLAANLVVGPLVTFVLIYGIALAFRDRKVVMFVAIFAAVAAVAAVLLAGSFTLDSLQMKNQIRPEQLRRFALTSGQALVKLVAQALGAGVLAFSAFRALRALRTPAARDARRQHTILTTAAAGGGVGAKAGVASAARAEPS